MKRPAILQTGETCLTVKTTRAACGNTSVRIVRRRGFEPVIRIQERDVFRDAPFGLAAFPPGDEVPDGVAVAGLAAVGDPVASGASPARDTARLTVGVDPPTVGVAGAVGPGFAEVGAAAGADGTETVELGFGGVGAGGGVGVGTRGVVGVGARGGFGTVVAGGCGTAGARIGSGSDGALTVTVGTVGTGTETARAWPARRPPAARPMSAAAARIPT
jgi:hypothetical protein